MSFRNWDMDLTIPEDLKHKFFNTCITGDVNLKLYSPCTNVLLCALPKSASLYITELIAKTLSYTNHQIGFNNGGGAVYYPRLVASKLTGTNTISHCHGSGDKNLLSMINKLDLKTIVLTRNLLDVIVSRRDMLIRDKRANNIPSQIAIDKFINGSEEYQIDLIIDLFAVNYINFYSSWKYACSKGKIDPLFITYEEMHSDKILFLKRIAEFLNTPVSNQEISIAVDKLNKNGGINFNRGIIGRGKQFFTSAQINKLLRLAGNLGCSDIPF